MDSELFDAAKDGNAAEVRRILLTGGTDPSATFGQFGRTPLHIACRGGHLNAVRALLVAEGDVDARDRDKKTALHIACAEGHSKEIVELLLIKGADVGAKNWSGGTPLHVAVWPIGRRYLKIAKLLLQQGADVNAKDEEGKTPLQRACFNSNLQAVKLLVQHVLRYDDVEARSNHLGAALSDALRANKYRLSHHDDDLEVIEAIVKVLLDNGANVNVADDAGTTALHLACSYTYVKTIRRLVGRGADLEAKDSAGRTPLIEAADYDTDEAEDEKVIVVKLLLDRGAEVSAAQNDGSTALHWACYSSSVVGGLKIPRLLLNRGADLEAKDEKNHTPLHWVCSSSCDDIDVVEELLRRGADICSKGKDQKTPFDEANAREDEGLAFYLKRQYEEKVWQREGLLSLHSILGAATYLENDNVQLPVGTITVDGLDCLLESIHSRNPDSIRSQDSNRSTPLHIACRTNAPIDVLCFIVEQDAAPLSMMDNAGSLPIHEACRGGASLEKIKLLVEKGGAVTLRARDFNCALPLHVVCQSNPSVDVVKFLVQSFPISVSQKTSAGALPCMLACVGSASESVLQFLLTKHPEALVAMKEYYSLEA